MKNYKIVILPRFKDATIHGELEPLPLVEVRAASSFVEAVAEAIKMVGILDHEWHEFIHEVVSVRQEKV